MSHSGHEIVMCSRCGIVIAQCRCDGWKVFGTLYSDNKWLCPKCQEKRKATIADVAESIEEKRTMDKVKFPTSEDVLCAIARGWCHPKNQYRVIDTNLANAIHAEIMDLFADQTDATEERRALEVMDAQDQMQEMRKVDK